MQQVLWNKQSFLDIWIMLQVLPWNNDSIIEKMDGWKWCRHITDWFEYTHTWNQEGIIISIYDIFLIHFLFCKNTVNLKELVDLPINSISLKKGMMTAGTYLKKTQYPWKYCIVASGLLKKWWYHWNVRLQQYVWKTIRFKWKYLSNTLYICNLWLQLFF